MVMAEQVEFADVEPVAVAVRAGIDLDLMAAAVEVAAEKDVIATRAGTLTAVIDVNERVDGDVQKAEPFGEVRGVELFKFEGIEPDAAAAAGADIDGEIGYGDRGQSMMADWAAHNSGEGYANMADDQAI